MFPDEKGQWEAKGGKYSDYFNFGKAILFAYKKYLSFKVILIFIY